MGKYLQARRQFLCCERIGPAEVKTKSGLIIDNEKTKNFVKYKVINIGEEIAENYQPGDVVMVEDTHTNIVPYGDKVFYLIDDAFVIAQEVDK